MQTVTQYISAIATESGGHLFATEPGEVAYATVNSTLGTLTLFVTHPTEPNKEHTEVRIIWALRAGGQVQDSAEYLGTYTEHLHNGQALTWFIYQGTTDNMTKDEFAAVLKLIHDHRQAVSTRSVQVLPERGPSAQIGFIDEIHNMAAGTVEEPDRALGLTETDWIIARVMGKSQATAPAVIQSTELSTTTCYICRGAGVTRDWGEPTPTTCWRCQGAGTCTPPALKEG